MVELAVLLEQCGYACAPSPLLGSAGAALVISAAGSDEQRAEWLPKLASGEATGVIRRRLSRGGEHPLLRPADRRRGRHLRRRGRVGGAGLRARVRADRDDRRDPLLRARLRAGGRAAPGRRRRRPRPDRGGDRRRAHRDRPAHPGDGGRLRPRAPAVRAADRRLPGGRPSLRGDAARHRGVALAQLLRGLDGRRRARVAADGRGYGRRSRRRTPAGRYPPRPSRCSAGSASPGSTTSSSGSSAAGSPAGCSPLRATTASGSPSSP